MAKKEAIHGVLKKHYGLYTILLTSITIMIVDSFHVPNPAVICLIAVVFAVFLAGIYYGIVSALLSFVYCCYFFSIQGCFTRYTNENLQKITVIFIALVTMVIMVGILRRRVDSRTKQLENANRQLSLLAVLDGLTGISNRRQFELTLEQEWKCNLHDGTPMSLAMIDIDFFKAYNDTYGHQAGDECLKQVANQIKGMMKRQGDFASRYGGEEFAVILSNTSPAGARAVMLNLCKQIENVKIPHQTSGISPFATVSIGVVTEVPSAANKASDLVRKADIALYQAKSNGRNQVQIYNESP